MNETINNIVKRIGLPRLIIGLLFLATCLTAVMIDLPFGLMSRYTQKIRHVWSAFSRYGTGYTMRYRTQAPLP